MGLQDFIVNAKTALQGDQLVRLVAAGAVAIFVVILVAAILFVIRLMSPAGRLESLLQDRAKSRKMPAWGIRFAAIILFAVAVVGSGRYLEAPSTCAQCHVKSTEAVALAGTAHKNVACGECHGGAGPTGTLRLGVSYARWTYSWMTGGQLPKQMRTTVEPLTCLGCHNDIGPTRVSAGIRVRHSDFLDAGIRCEECHSGVAHPEVTPDAKSPSMDECLPCHNGKTASSECSTCHRKDVALQAATRREPARIQALKIDCYSCHPEKKCLQCHAVSMPHPDGWSPDRGAPAGTAGTHARVAFLNKEYCWRCHFGKGSVGNPTQEACTCHSLQTRMGMHGGKPWIKEHGLEATGQKQGSLAECFLCHSSTLCSNCHPAEYEKKYNPKVGYDNYPKEGPPPPAQFLRF